MKGLGKSGVTLINNVQQAVQANISKVLKALGVPSDLVYKKLDPLDFEQYQIKHKRAQLLHQYTASTPLSFLKALYARSHSLPGNTVRQGVSLRRLFREYREAKIHNIESEHLDDFIETMLDNSKFLRPLRLSTNTEDERLLVHGYFRLKKLRQMYLNQLNELFTDLKAHELPISTKEQNKLIYYTFFRDKKDISDGLEKVLEKWGRPQRHVNDFTLDHYRGLELKHTESFNNILRICLMQQNHKIFQEVSKEIVPDRETFKIWLEAYSDVFKDKGQFESVIPKIDVTMDITLLNLVMKGYVLFGEIDRAEEILETIELSPVTDPLYHYLSFENKKKYDKYLKYYDNLSKFIEMDPIKIIPNIETFTPFIRYYTEVQPNKNRVFSILHNMESINLPLNTKIFEILVGKFDPYSSIEILNILLQLFEKLYSNDADLARHNKVLEHDGQLIKLRDSVVFKLSKSLSPLDKRITELAGDLKSTIRDIRRNNEYNDLFIKNEIVYRKLCYLREIYRIVEDLEPQIE